MVEGFAAWGLWLQWAATLWLVSFSAYLPADGRAVPDHFRSALADTADAQTLLHSALLASGVATAEELATLRQRVLEVAARLPDGSPYATCRRVHQVLHQELLLGQYRTMCTQVDRAIQYGDYNCVSAAILFAVLARQAGLDVRFQAFPGHINCYVPQLDMDVEPTEPPGSGRAMRPHGGRGGQVVSDAGAIARLLYNRGVAFLQQGAHADAARMLSESLLWDPHHRDTWNNLRATLNNWALDQGRRGRFDEARRHLGAAWILCGPHPALAANDLFVHQKLLESLCRQGAFARAESLWQHVARRHPDNPYVAAGWRLLYSKWLARETASRQLGLTRRLSQQAAKELAHRAPRRNAGQGNNGSWRPAEGSTRSDLTLSAP